MFKEIPGRYQAIDIVREADLGGYQAKGGRIAGWRPLYARQNHLGCATLLHIRPEIHKGSLMPSSQRGPS